MKKRKNLCVITHQCSKIFNEKYLLTRHTKVANEGLKQYPCTICEQKFKSPSEVSSYKKIKHGEEKKKEESFECYNT